MHLLVAYELMGGEIVLRHLVYRFMILWMKIRIILVYASCIHRNFVWVNRCPSLYVEKYGEPRLSSRHLTFSIGIDERDQWLSCMNQVMDEFGLEEQLRKSLTKVFEQTADFMRNQPE